MTFYVYIVYLYYMKPLKITKSITNRETPSFEKYLSEVSKTELINAEKEVELALLIKKGNQKAINQLVNSNLRFVISVAKQYAGRGMSVEDLVSEGNIGLIKAAQKWDETRGIKFISYAVWWIRQAILQALAEQARIVRLPLNKIGTINKLNRAFSELEQKHERPPSAEELAEFMGVSVSDVKQSLQSNGRHVSMDAPLTEGDESSSSLYDVLPNTYSDTPDVDLVKESLRKDIERSLSTLTSREGEVVRLYFGLNGRYPLTLEEIGDKFDLTRERVRQIKEKAIRRMKHTSRSKMLKNYL